MAKNNKKNEKEKKSIDILVDKIITIVGTMIQKANYDVTFESTIVKKVKQDNKINSGKYLYTIRHNGHNYDVKSGIGEIKSTDKVWVKIQSGNMSKMYICGIRE